MGIRRLGGAARRAGWWAVIAATIVTPCTVFAVDASGGARIHYYEPVQLLPSAASNAVRKGSALSRELRFEAYGRRFDISLQENTRVTGQLKSGSTGTGLTLYAGELEGIARSWVRLAIGTDTMRGMVWDGEHLYVIEPAVEALDSLVPPLAADPSSTLVFRLADVMIESGATACATDGTVSLDKADHAFESLVQELKGAPALMQAAGAARRLEVSLLGDSKFLARYPDAQQARDAILTRINNVDGIFSAQLGIEVRAGDLSIDDAANDRLSAQSSPSALLTELAKLRKQTPALHSAGLTHLFTGRDLEGTTIGIAYLGSVCHKEHGAGLTESRNTWLDSLVAAHEIGHNFGADHDGDSGGSCASAPSSGYIMASAVSGNDKFSQCSVDRMRVRAQSATCISFLPPANVTLPASLGEVRQPVSRPFEWALEISNAGGMSANNVYAELTLPAAVSISEAYVAGGTCTSGAGYVQCHIDAIAGGNSRAIYLTLRSDTLGSQKITAHVNVSNDGNYSDNFGAGTIVFSKEADVEMVLEAPQSASVNGSFDLAFRAINRAAIGTEALTVAIDVPAGVTVRSATLGGGDCAVESARVRCALSSLAPYASASGTLTLVPASAGSLALKASISGDYFDPNSANDSADAVIAVTGTTTSSQSPSPSSGSASDTSGGGGGGGSFGSLLLGLCLLRLRRRR